MKAKSQFLGSEEEKGGNYSKNKELFSELDIKRTCTQDGKTSTCSRTNSEEWHKTWKKTPAVLKFRLSWGRRRVLKTTEKGSLTAMLKTRTSED